MRLFVLYAPQRQARRALARHGDALRELIPHSEVLAYAWNEGRRSLASLTARECAEVIELVRLKDVVR